MHDWQLIQEFVKSDSQAAFGRLVERHLNFVYSTCLREIGDSALAEDATQAVFLLLWQKAATLRPETVLAGWLFQTARFVSKNARKQEIRHQQRTQKAAEAMMHEMTTQPSAEEDNWAQIQPLLHDAMSTLNAGDRSAVLLRCFEARSLKETGEALGVSEDAARKRVSRALEKLRRYFTRHGVTLSMATLAALLSSHAVQAAPASLAAAMTTAFSAAAVSMSAGTAAAGTAATGAVSTKAVALVENARHAWLLLKLKTAATAVCGVSLVAVGSKQLTPHEQPAIAHTAHLKPAPQIRVAKVKTNDKPRLAAVPKREIARAASLKPASPEKATAKPQSSRVLAFPAAKSEIKAPRRPMGQSPRREDRVFLPAPKSEIERASETKKLPMTNEKPIGESLDSPAKIAPKQVLTREQIPTRDNERIEEMQMKKTMATALAGAALMASALAPQASLAAEGDKGRLDGMLTAKGENWIEVRADDAKESKRYVANWVGGLPKDGGGPDKAMLETIKKLRVPNRVRLNWAFIERLRVVSVEWFEPTDKTGVVEGEVTAKGENWIEVKSGDKPIERYSPRWIGNLPKDGGGLDKAALQAIAEVKVGDKVRLEWAYEERLRVVSLKKQ